jgi:dihydrofolate reductase
MTKLAAIVAMDRSRLIGDGGKLPWHLPEDMKRFKALTEGGIVLMGRKTYESIPDRFRPLSNRVNVVVSRSWTESPEPGVVVFSSPEEAVQWARAEAGERTIWVIGGAELYQQLLPVCDEVHLTLVNGRHRGDRWLSDFETQFRLVHDEPGEGCRYLTFQRLAAPLTVAVIPE